MITHNI